MKKQLLFEENYASYKNIISNIAIVGYSETDIISRGIKTFEPLELTCLFSYPEPDEATYNQMTYEMMFPDKNYNIECPKFFSLNLTNEYGNRSYLYCLKFSEKYIFNNFSHSYEINLPLVICIKSNKDDLEPFRQLLTSINQIIVSENLDYEPSVVNNYKKVELLNIFYFIFSLPHTPPHSLVRLKLNNEICEVEKDIDFYFSSNCEIPCNKNDTDINLLFCFLDQTIIIKVIIAILGEKQIIFRSSQAYILHLIIPTFLKLIFPFKWQQAIVTVLPNKEAEDYLDKPGAFIFGILSNALTVQNIIDKYPDIIVVDCDTNEIFGGEENVPYIPGKSNGENNLKISTRKKKDKNSYNNVEGGIKQGKNIFIVDGCYIYQYDPENISDKGIKMKFNEKNNIIIDTQKSQLLVHKNNDFVTSSEIKWLRKNFQMIRNPEIFDIENINMKQKDNKNSKNFNLHESIILPNRSFSYNIQNILMHFYLNKISEPKSKFMEYIKNLYINYTSVIKFQNNSGKKIVENIKETSDNPKSIENCFIVEFNKRIFSALNIIDELDKKIIEQKKEISEKEKSRELYRELKKILMNYCLVLGINNNGKNVVNNFDFNINEKLLEMNQSKTIIKQKNPNKKGHVKSNHSLLQFTLNQNTNFNFAGIDKSSKDYFKFYTKDGFLYFINNMNDYFNKNNKKLGDIHRFEIFNELFNKYKTLDNIFKEEKEEENEIIIDILNEDFEEEEEINENENEINEINTDSIKIKDNNNSSNLINPGKKKLLDELESSGIITNINDKKKLFMIEENDEEKNDSVTEKSIKLSDNKDGEILGNIILNSFKSDENLINDENNNMTKNESIICFPGNESKNSSENENIFNLGESNKSNIINNNNLTQYYLFLASYLEEILDIPYLLDIFAKEIMKTVKINLDIYKLIVKLYKEAYKNSGEKHRDFPYFTFYTFLNRLNGKNLEKIEKYLSDDNYNFAELMEIFYYVTSNKNIKIHKQEEVKDNQISDKRSHTINESNYISPQKNDENRLTSKNIEFHSKTLEFPLKEKDEIIIINEKYESLFEPNSLQTLNQFCTLLIYSFPSPEDIKTKSVQQIIEDRYIQITKIDALKEFLGELKKINLSQMKSQLEKLCFWLNSFNYLLLFSIFYLKPYLNERESWEKFLKNIQYNIGGNNFSFVDMLYILFKKNIFFPESKYSPKDYVKKNIVDISKEKGISQDIIFISPLLLYIPTREFFKPILFDKIDLQSQIMARLSTSILALIKWDPESKILHLGGLLCTEANFEAKGYSKYKPYIKDEIFKILKGKKYKKTTRLLNWELCFDNLLEYKLID